MRATGRAHPFELMFGGFREERFPAIRAVLRDASDIHAFLLAAPALELMRELRPDAGLGDAVDDFVALVHAAYLFWRDGEHTVVLDEPSTRRFCARAPEGGGSWVGPGAHTAPPLRRARRTDPRSTAAIKPTIVQYIQVAPRIVWGQLNDEQPFEPLDGWFAIPGETGLRVVACFGVHDQRPGVSVSVVAGQFPANVVRTDGRPLFAPTMPGGDAAHLHAVSVPEELLLLGWRAAAGEEVAQ